MGAEGKVKREKVAAAIVSFTTVLPCFSTGVLKHGAAAYATSDLVVRGSVEAAVGGGSPYMKLALMTRSDPITKKTLRTKSPMKK